MTPYKAIMIGGSAGSFQVVTNILSSLPKTYRYPIFLALHRLKHVRSGFVEALSIKSNIPVIEPNDKSAIKPGIAYLAPANYHMFIELGNKFALSTEEPLNHSRPAIDLSFFTAASAYRQKLVGIILSGANRDGAKGLQKVKQQGGHTIVQDPDDCQVNAMTRAALEICEPDQILDTKQIIDFLQKIN